jgi:2'-5' RNA ligase
VKPDAIPDSVFDHARSSFAAAGQTLQNIRRDFPEWHLGRPRYALWALDVDVAPVRAAVAGAARHLDELLLDNYHRQAHITLALCGFPTGSPSRPDDFGPVALDTCLAALQALALGPFEVEIGRLASFTSAPFLAARDVDGGIHSLRRALTGGQSEPGGPYTPHVTVGLYGGAWPTARVQPRLDSFDAHPPVRCHIERLSLMSYAAPEIGGRLETMADFCLVTRRLSWRDGEQSLRLAPTNERTATTP